MQHPDMSIWYMVFYLRQCEYKQQKMDRNTRINTLIVLLQFCRKKIQTGTENL